MAGRSRRPVAVGDILARLLDDVTGRGGGGASGPKAGPAKVRRVLAAFDRIGPPVTDHADAVDFRRGVLTLQVHESAWLTELTFLRTEIIDRLNRMVGPSTVREVRLRSGSRRKRPAPPTPPPRPLTESQREAVATWTASIADDAVREAVQRAAARSLARGEVKVPEVSGPPGPRLKPAEPVVEPAPMTYGYGHGTHAGGERAERPGWTKDRWASRKRGGGGKS